MIDNVKNICISKNVTEAGQYYFYVKDSWGRTSKCAVVFYETSLNETKVNVDGNDIEKIITLSGYSYAIPKAEKQGYKFCGWKSNSILTTPTYFVGQCTTANRNINLYAVWEKNENNNGNTSSNGNNNTIGNKNDVTIQKKAQKITAKSFTKTYGSRAFSLNAKTNGNGKLTYKSSNNKVAKISSTGKVTIKGCGKVTIIVNASETSDYKVATKKITITVKPKKGKLSKVTSPKKATIKITWSRLKGITGYQLQISGNKKFGKGVLQRYFSKKQKSITVPLLKKSGKKYYVRIRSYKQTRGRDYYGKWSKVKSVKVK